MKVSSSFLNLKPCVMLFAALALFVVVCAAVPETGKAAGDRGLRARCGPVQPESVDGHWYNYGVARGVSCRTAAKVKTKALNKFCRKHSRCPTKSVKGKVRYGRWTCKVNYGYVSYWDMWCRKPGARFSWHWLS